MNSQTFKDPTNEYLSKFKALILSKLDDGDLSDEDCKTIMRQARAYAGGKGKGKKMLPDESMTASEKSYNAIIDEINAALRSRYPSTNGDSRYWAREVYSNYAIVSDWTTNKYYKVPYMLNADDYTFGDFEEVEQEVEYKKVKAMEVADICATGNGFRLFVESSFSEPPDWMPLLPKPGEFEHKEYGKISITKDRNESFIANFKDKVYQSKLPINAEHTPSAEGAYGWITDLRLNEDESVDAQVSWTDLGQTAIKNDRFQYVSPEWFDSWNRPSDGKKYKDVVIGCALTVRPFFKESHLRPLVASETGLSVGSVQEQGERKDGAQYEIIFLTAATPISNNTEVVKIMAEENKDDAANEKRFAELENQFKAMSEQLTAKDNELKVANEVIKSQGESITEMQKAARKARFTETAKSFVGKVEDHLSLMEFFAEHDEKGEDGEKLKAYVETQTALSKQIKESNLFSELGHDAPGNSNSALDRMNAEAAKLMASDPKLTQASAFARVMDTKPELYSEYKAESHKGVN